MTEGVYIEVAFVDLNNSMLHEGVYIEVASKAVIEKPIKISH